MNSPVLGISSTVICMDNHVLGIISPVLGNNYSYTRYE